MGGSVLGRKKKKLSLRFMTPVASPGWSASQARMRCMDIASAGTAPISMRWRPMAK